MTEILKRIIKSNIHNLVIGDLGIKLARPGDALDLLALRTFYQIMNSKELDIALSNNWIELYDENGSLLTGTEATRATNHATLGNSGEGATATVESETSNGTKTLAFTIDFSASRFHTVTINAAGLAITLTPPDTASTLILRVVQGAGGSATLLWDDAIKWPGGTAPTLSTVAGSMDIISFYYDGTVFYGNTTFNMS